MFTLRRNNLWPNWDAVEFKILETPCETKIDSTKERETTFGSSYSWVRKIEGTGFHCTCR